MKLALRIMMAVAIAFVAIACKSGVSNDAAKQLVEKYNKGERISDAEWSQAIDLFTAYVDEAYPQAKRAAAGDADAAKTLADIDERYAGVRALGQMLVEAYRTAAIPTDCRHRLTNTLERYIDMQ